MLYLYVVTMNNCPVAWMEKHDVNNLSLIPKAKNDYLS